MVSFTHNPYAQVLTPEYETISPYGSVMESTFETGPGTGVHAIIEIDHPQNPLRVTVRQGSSGRHKNSVNPCHPRPYGDGDVGGAQPVSMTNTQTNLSLSAHSSEEGSYQHHYSHYHPAQQHHYPSQHHYNSLEGSMVEYPAPNASIRPAEVALRQQYPPPQEVASNYYSHETPRHPNHLYTGTQPPCTQDDGRQIIAEEPYYWNTPEPVRYDQEERSPSSFCSCAECMHQHPSSTTPSWTGMESRSPSIGTPIPTATTTPRDYGYLSVSEEEVGISAEHEHLELGGDAPRMTTLLPRAATTTPPPPSSSSSTAGSHRSFAPMPVAEEALAVVPQQRPPTPTPTPSSAPALPADAASSNVYHTELVGKLSYYAFPSKKDLLAERAAVKAMNAAKSLKTPEGDAAHQSQKQNCVFFGQISFEATHELMVWLVQLLVSTNQDPAEEFAPTYVHPLGRGGAWKMFFANNDTSTVKAFMSANNGRLLFDKHGLWLAQNEEELALLEGYVASWTEALNELTPRIPKQLIVVRE